MAQLGDMTHTGHDETGSGVTASGPKVTSIRPGVGIVLYDTAGRLLLHERRVGGGWAPPSGAVEPGETLIAALHRELAEETALTATIERVVGVYSDPAYQIVAYPDGRVIHFVTTLFVCQVTSGTLVGSDEGLAWGWFAPDALPPNLTAYARVWLADALAPDAEPPVIR
jgi:8-oxo-dGTP diphosphatase